MKARHVVLDYNIGAELMLTRVTLMRAGVPERVLDRHLPPGPPGPPERP